MVPLCYRTATVNGLKNPACILHAPYCDVQDANEMRTVENAKWYISSISGAYRILPHPIYTMYISRDFNSCFLLVAHLSVFSRSSVGRMLYPNNKQSTKTTATRNEQRWGFKRLFYFLVHVLPFSSEKLIIPSFLRK